MLVPAGYSTWSASIALHYRLFVVTREVKHQEQLLSSFAELPFLWNLRGLHGLQASAFAGSDKLLDARSTQSLLAC